MFFICALVTIPLYPIAIFGFLIGVFTAHAGSIGGAVIGAIMVATGVGGLWVGVALMVKRLHDIGLSGLHAIWIVVLLGSPVWYGETDVGGSTGRGSRRRRLAAADPGTGRRQHLRPGAGLATPSNVRRPEMTTIGATHANRWRVDDTATDLTRPRLPPRSVRVAARHQDVVIDLASSVMVVIDMQNRFCHPAMAPDGNERPTRRPIAPLARLLPALRGAACRCCGSTRQPHGPHEPAAQRAAAVPADGNAEPFLPKGSWEAEIDPLLVPAEPGDIHVDKYRISGFFDTPLDAILRNLRATTLLFAGVNLDQCVCATLVDAACLGYDCVLVADCAATGSPEYCTQATLYNVRRGFGFVVKADDVIGAIK